MLVEYVKQFNSIESNNREDYVDLFRIIEKEMTENLDKGQILVSNKKLDSFDHILSMRDKENQELLNRNSIVDETPFVAIPDFAKFLATKVRKFLDVYYLGYLKSISITPSSIVHIVIGCRLNDTCRSIVQRKQKDDAFAMLDKLGIKLSNNNIEASNENTTIIMNLLKDNGARSINITSYYNKYNDLNVIKEIDIGMRMTDVATLKEREAIEVEKSDCLDKYQIQNIKKKMLSAFDAAKTIQMSPNMLDVCGYLVLSYLSDIADELQCDCESRSGIHDLHDKRRNKNIEIDKISSEIGRNADVNIMDKAMEDIRTRIDNYLHNEANLRVVNLECNEYGQIKGEALWYRSSQDRYDYVYYRDFNLDENTPTEEEVELMYDNIASKFSVMPYGNDTLLLSNEHNIITLDKILSQIGLSMIETKTSFTRNGASLISDIDKIVFSVNISSLYQ